MCGSVIGHQLAVRIEEPIITTNLEGLQQDLEYMRIDSSSLNWLFHIIIIQHILSYLLSRIVAFVSSVRLEKAMLKLDDNFSWLTPGGLSIIVARTNNNHGSACEPFVQLQLIRTERVFVHPYLYSPSQDANDDAIGDENCSQVLKLSKTHLQHVLHWTAPSCYHNQWLRSIVTSSSNPAPCASTIKNNRKNSSRVAILSCVVALALLYMKRWKGLTECCIRSLVVQRSVRPSCHFSSPLPESSPQNQFIIALEEYEMNGTRIKVQQSLSWTSFWQASSAWISSVAKYWEIIASRSTSPPERSLLTLAWKVR